MVVAIVLASIGLGLVAFAWWGMNTRAGQQAFDEMAGMIPFFAGVAGAILVVVALGIAGWRMWRG
jgi:hypothetical protein